MIGRAARQACLDQEVPGSPAKLPAGNGFSRETGPRTSTRSGRADERRPGRPDLSCWSSTTYITPYPWGMGENISRQPPTGKVKRCENAIVGPPHSEAARVVSPKWVCRTLRGAGRVLASQGKDAGHYDQKQDGVLDRVGAGDLADVGERAGDAGQRSRGHPDAPGTGTHSEVGGTGIGAARRGRGRWLTGGNLQLRTRGAEGVVRLAPERGDRRRADHNDQGRHVRVLHCRGTVFRFQEPNDPNLPALRAGQPNVAACGLLRAGLTPATVRSPSRSRTSGTDGGKWVEMTRAASEFGGIDWSGCSGAENNAAPADWAGACDCAG